MNDRAHRPWRACRRRALPACFVAAALIVLTACGATDVRVHVPRIPKVGETQGDTATFEIDGGSISVTESGSILLQTGIPGLSYSGPRGCEGHFFDADYSEHIPIYFRYTAVDAVMAVGQSGYHFSHGPEQQDNQLVWDETFTDAGSTRHLVARVACELPSDTTPLVAPG